MTATRYTDLSIHVRMAWNRQHILNGGPPEAIVPGWFLRVTRNEGYDDVVGETALTKEEVDRIAFVVDEILAERLGNPCRVGNAVDAAARAQRAELERRLAGAEATAAQIPNLRAALGMLEAGEHDA